MKLVYYLEQYKASTLRKILNEHGVNTKARSPLQLLDLLLERLLDREYLQNFFETMSKEEQGVLHYFIIHRPCQLFSLRSLQQSGSMSRDHFEKGLYLLQRKGMLFKLRRSYGEIGYGIPYDLFQRCHQVLLGKYMHQCEAKKLAVEPIENEYHHNIDEDFFTFLTLLYYGPFTLTKTGSIPQQTVKQWSKSFTHENYLEFFPIQIKNGEQHKKVSLFLHVGNELGLIDINNNTLQLNSRLNEWISASRNDRIRYLESVIQKSFQSTDLLVNHVFHSLFSLPKEVWFQVQELVAVLAEQLNRPIDREFFYRIEQEIIKPLSILGILNFTGDWQSKMLLKMNEIDQEEYNQIYVQSNFEVLVPRQCSLSIRLELEQFASLEQQDEMYLYRITQDSILNGLEKGKKIEDILHFLIQYSAIPIHPSLEATLKNWANRYEAIQFYDVRILKCQNEDIANHLKEQIELQGLFIGEIDPVHLLVRKDKSFHQGLLQIKKLGYFPSENIKTEKDFIITNKSQEVIGSDEEEIETDFILYKHSEYEIMIEME